MACCRSLLLLVALFFAGCAASPAPAVKQLVPTEGQALLTTYLSSSGSALDSASFTIEKLALYHKDTWIELDLPPIQIDTQKNRNQQILLGAALAPEGELHRLRFSLRNLVVDGHAVMPEGQVEIVELTLAEPMFLSGRDSQCLFLDWTLEVGQVASSAMRPGFTAWGQRPQLGTGLVYVACQGVDTIFVLRSDSNKIVASFPVSGTIGDIHVVQSSRRLYVMCPSKRSLFVYDCVKGRLVEQIFLPGTIAPEYFVLDTARQSAYVTDSVSGLVLKLDLASGAVLAQRPVGHRPEKLILLKGSVPRIAVLSPKSQQVSVLNGENLAVQWTFPVGQQVVDLLYTADQLYVVEQASNTVATYQVESGMLLSRIQVGSKPQDLLAIDSESIYVSNQGSNSLSVIVPGQNISLRRIPAGAAPDELAYSRQRQLGYVLSAKNRTLSVLDLRGEYLRQIIPLPGAPDAIAVLD